MSFLSAIFGGPSDQEKQIAGAEQNLAGQQAAGFNQQLSSALNSESNLSAQLTPIANMGPSQMGWSPQLAAAVSTQNIDAAAAAARNAQQATSTALAGQGGGGTSGIASGIDAQIRGTEASAAENQLSQSQLQATEANAAQGNQNWQRAVAGENSLAGIESGSASQLGNLATESNKEAFGQANQINQQKGTVLGDIGKLAGAALPFITGGLSNVMAGGANAGSETGGGVEQFFSGGLDALSQ